MSYDFFLVYELILCRIGSFHVYLDKKRKIFCFSGITIVPALVPSLKGIEDNAKVEGHRLRGKND